MKNKVIMIKKHILTTAVIVSLVTACTKNTDTNLPNAITYTCENGKKLNVTYLISKENIRHARIKSENASYDLKNVISASGAKYSDGKYTWWTKGYSGFFEIDDTITMKNCVSKEER